MSGIPLIPLIIFQNDVLVQLHCSSGNVTGDGGGY